MLRVETRRSVALVASPLVLVAAWWMAWNGIYGSMYEAKLANIYIWQETSGVIKDSILTTGPILAGLSAWVAGREVRRGIGDLLTTTAKPQAFRILATWASTVIPFVTVYVLLALLLGYSYGYQRYVGCAATRILIGGSRSVADGLGTRIRSGALLADTVCRSPHRHRAIRASPYADGFLRCWCKLHTTFASRLQ